MNPILPAIFKIRYPEVPKEEQDPRLRVNVMRKLFSASLPPRKDPSELNSGLYQEIKTAMILIQEHKITHGRQISRSQTPEEIRQGLNGTSQSIMVPTASGGTRELDFVYTDLDGKPVIVEAKSTQMVDKHQLEVNVKLAYHHGGKVVYSLDGDKPSQVEALKEDYAQLRDEGGRPYPPGLLHIMHTEADGMGTQYLQGKLTIPPGGSGGRVQGSGIPPGQAGESNIPGLGNSHEFNEVGAVNETNGYIEGGKDLGLFSGLAPIATEEAILDDDFNPDAGGEWEWR